MRYTTLAILSLMVLPVFLAPPAFAKGHFAEIACTSRITDKETGESLYPTRAESTFAGATKSAPVLVDTINYHAYIGVTDTGYMIRLVDNRVTHLPFGTGQLAIATADRGANHLELGHQSEKVDVNIYCWFNSVVAD